MPTDFERDLSELLHTVTPQPPDQLAQPDVRRLLGIDDAEILEFAPRAVGSPRRKLRWRPLAAAAVVAALAAAGVVAVTEIRPEHSTPHQPPVAGPIGPAPRTIPATPTRPECTSDQIVISQVTVGPNGANFARRGSAGIIRFSYANRSTKRCALDLTSVAIGPDYLSDGTRFPAVDDPVELPGDGKIVFTAHVRVAGQCRPVKNGLSIIITRRRAWTYSWGLGVDHCTLTPVRVTHN